MLSEQDRVQLLDLMNKMMAHLSRNSVFSMDPNAEAEGNFIDDSVALFRDVIRPTSKKLTVQLRDKWAEKAKEPPQMDSAPRQH